MCQAGTDTFKNGDAFQMFRGLRDPSKNAFQLQAVLVKTGVFISGQSEKSQAWWNVRCPRRDGRRLEEFS